MSRVTADSSARPAKYAGAQRRSGEAFSWYWSRGATRAGDDPAVPAPCVVTKQCPMTAVAYGYASTSEGTCPLAGGAEGLLAPLRCVSRYAIHDDIVHDDQR